jgi:recombination DNA repair RAD52 pathway protein
LTVSNSSLEDAHYNLCENSRANNAYYNLCEKPSVAAALHKLSTFFGSVLGQTKARIQACIAKTKAMKKGEHF